MPINHRRSTATLAPPISTVPSGSITSRLRGSVVYFRLRAACSVSMMPTAPTTLASTGAVRSGLETATWTSAPNPAATSSATTTDTHVGGGPTSHDGSHGIGRRSSPSWRKLKTYRGTVAIAAAAKLMTPVPWYVTTIPMRQRRVHGPEAQPEEEEQDVLAHVRRLAPTVSDSLSPPARGADDDVVRLDLDRDALTVPPCCDRASMEP